MTRVRRAAAANALPLAVAAAAFMVAVGLPSADADMWWHLASGKWMVDHGTGLRVDVFSSTATGEPYALGQWLGDIVLYGSYALGGWSGVAVLRAALVALAAFSVTRLALRAASARIAVPLAALALVLSKPVWTDRPQLFTLALFPLVLDLCIAARAGSRASLVAAVAIVLFWANLHGGYALGLALLWIFALEAVLERRPALAPLAAAFATTILVTLEPGALTFLRALSHVAGSDVRIAEESPVDPLTPFGALFAVFVGGTLALLMLRRGTLLGAMVLLPLLALALSAQRHIPLFGFAAVPFVAGPLTAVLTSLSLHVSWGRSGTERSRSGPDAHASSRRLAPGVAAVLWIAALASIATAPSAPDTSAYPAGAVDALKASDGVLLNEYDWGGYLIWAVPERPVFVDGRLYPFAGNGVMTSYLAAVHVQPSWRAVIDRWNVSQALVRPDRALVQALRDEGWSVRAQDRDFVLLERPR